MSNDYQAILVSDGIYRIKGFAGRLWKQIGLNSESTELEQISALWAEVPVDTLPDKTETEIRLFGLIDRSELLPIR